MTGCINLFSRSQPINMRFWPSVRSRWLNIGQVLICDFIKRKKERGECSVILNEQAFIKYLLYGQKVSLYLRDQRGKSRASRSDGESKCRIRFILPTPGFRNIIKIVIYSQSFRRASCRLPAMWFGLKSDWFVWISATGVATRTSKKKRFKQAKIYVRNTCWYISFIIYILRNTHQKAMS